jgi:hypothetical protein
MITMLTRSKNKYKKETVEIRSNMSIKILIDLLRRKNNSSGNIALMVISEKTIPQRIRRGWLDWRRNIIIHPGIGYRNKEYTWPAIAQRTVIRNDVPRSATRISGPKRLGMKNPMITKTRNTPALSSNANAEL